MKTLKLADGLSLPIAAVTEKLAWLGRTGSGKSYGAMKLAELMLEAGAQIGVLDPVGVWRSLRVPASKDGQAFEVVVFGGLYGDLPLSHTSGALVADLVVDRGLSFVLDVSQWIPSEQQEFARTFAHRFFHRKKSAPSAVHLFLEECQEWIPENPSGREALTLGEFQRLWKLGRNFGIGGSLISQRPQEIAKKALNMSGTLFAFQMTGPQERKAIRAWVADQGVAVDIEGVLQKLKVGEPHVESPMFLEVSKTVRILPRVTADLSSTPLVGSATAAKRALTPIDVEQLKVALAETIEKAKADDPRELRKELASVRQQLAQAQRDRQQNLQASPPVVLAKAAPVLTDADRAILERLDSRILGFTEAVKSTDRVQAAVDAFARTILGQENSDLRRVRDELLKLLDGKRLGVIRDKVAEYHKIAISRQPQERPGQPRPRPEAHPGRASVATRPATRPVVTGSGEAMPPGERAVLTAAAMWTDGVSKDQLGVLTGYKRSSRDAYVARLSLKGWVDATNGHVVATPSGLAALGDFEPLPTGDALLQWWLERLPIGERRVLEVLVGHGGNAIDREDLDEPTGFKRSSRDAYLSRLSARRLVVNVGRGQVAASAELFG